MQISDPALKQKSLKLLSSKAGRRSRSRGRRLFFVVGWLVGLAAASNWCTECAQLCHKGCAVESHHATKFNAAYGLGFQPVPDGSLADFGQFCGFDDVDKAVVLSLCIHVCKRRVVGVPDNAIRLLRLPWLLATSNLLW